MWELFFARENDGRFMNRAGPGGRHELLGDFSVAMYSWMSHRTVPYVAPCWNGTVLMLHRMLIRGTSGHEAC